MINLIYFVTMYPILILFYFVIKWTYKTEKDSLFAVTMKPEWKETKEVQQVISDFKKEMKRDFWVLMLVPFTSLLTRHFSIQTTIWMIWLFASIVIMFVPFAKGNKKLKEWKKEHNVYEEASMEKYVELKAAGGIRRVSFFPFFLPTLLGFVAVGLDGIFPYLYQYWYSTAMIPEKGVSIAALEIAACSIIFWICAVVMDRQPAEVISSDSDVNVNYARAKKNVWKNFWLICVWGNTGFTITIVLASFFTENAVTILIFGAILYAVIILVLAILLIRSLQHIEKHYETKHDMTSVTDEDDNWIFGMFYYNPGDKRTVVNKKVGIGTTLNMATPIGKVTSIFTTIVLLALPVLCIWLISEEFTPIHLDIKDDTLRAVHLRTEYQIDTDDIENLKMITELPKWSKSDGTGMDTLEKGTYYIRNVGKCQVFLNPQNSEFLYFQADGTDYYMSGYDDVQTEAIYETLQNK